MRKPVSLSLRIKVSELNSYEGGCTSQEVNNTSVSLEQTTSLPAGNVWSCVQNNNNNEYYLSLADGSFNNNNKNNTNYCVPVEPKEFIEIVFLAEADCWKNKHSSWDAVKYHYHMGRRIWMFIERLSNYTYEPWKSICFIIFYPRPREVFAAHYQDRIAHHIAAPYIIAIAEKVHNAHGNVSFGNRKGVSAYHAAVRIQKLMQEHPNGYVASFDIKGFFMSIDKDIAWERFCRYEQQYRPVGYSDGMRQFLMRIIEQMIRNDPSKNCERHCLEEWWDKYIPPNKTLFKSNGKGLPIGNFYAQLMANIILAELCEEYVTEFVDDFAIVVDTLGELHDAERKLCDGLKALKLQMHPTKKYRQQVRHGLIGWCGYTIYSNRIYVNNRPINNCIYKLKNHYGNANIKKSQDVIQMLNSYFGMMCHCNEWNTQCRIRDVAVELGYSKYIDFIEKQNHIVCRLKPIYKRQFKSFMDITKIDNLKYGTNMIVMPVPANSKHYEKCVGKFIYRYGYQPIEGDEVNVSACVEETPMRLKEAVIKQHVQDYCAKVGIPDEWNPADYGFED